MGIDPVEFYLFEIETDQGLTEAADGIFVLRRLLQLNFGASLSQLLLKVFSFVFR